jgi:phage shock protein A
MTVEQLVAQVRALETELSLLKAQVKSVEAQLAVVKAELQAPEISAPTKTFGDLYGIYAGQMDLTEEEIDSALYRLDWEDGKPAGTGA